MRAIVVDDEDLARGIVREYLASYPDIQVIGECSSAFDAVKAVAKLKPNFILLDVQMPKVNGFEVLQRKAQGVPFVPESSFLLATHRPAR